MAMKWKRATASVLAGVVLTTTSPFAVGDVRGGCDNKDCGENGMCALTCKKDKDCPGDQTCHGGWCYFQCGFDEDCADGQRCNDDHFCSWD